MSKKKKKTGIALVWNGNGFGFGFGFGLELGLIGYYTKFGYLYSPDEIVHDVCYMSYFLLLFFFFNFQ